MPSSDQILSFLLAVLVHLLGLLLAGNCRSHLSQPDETLPELTVSSVELMLASLESEDLVATPAAGAAAEPPAAEARPAVELPQPVEPTPPPVLPDKPVFTQALAPAPEPAPQPSPAPLPEPKPAPLPPAPPPPAPQTDKPTAALPGSGAEKATIQPSGGSSGRIDAHPSLSRPIKPNYPIGSRRRGEEGTVILDVAVAPDGSARAVSLVASSGFAELDRAAERAAAQARFKPGMRNSSPVEAAARITIIFRLRDE